MWTLCDKPFVWIFCKFFFLILKYLKIHDSKNYKKVTRQITEWKFILKAEMFYNTWKKKT